MCSSDLIISVSLAKGNAGPGDGTGAINEIIDRASDAGVLWVIAAGNEGETHWGGRWNDPDGNGIELYRDRPETEWPRDAKGELQMHTRELDLGSLLKELPT